MLFADKVIDNFLTRPNKMLCLWYTEEIKNNLSGLVCAFFGVGRIYMKYNTTR